MTFGFKTFTLLLHMQFFNLHTHKFTNNPVVFELVNQYPWEFDSCIPHFSIGIHPWYINEERLTSDLKTIEDKLKLEECLALGECGLDKRIEVPMTFQIDVFEKQMKKIRLSLKWLNREMEGKQYYLEDTFSYADIAVGSALGYVQLRYPEIDFKNEYLNLYDLYELLMQRPSFQTTVPEPYL